MLSLFDVERAELLTPYLRCFRSNRLACLAIDRLAPIFEERGRLLDEASESAKRCAPPARFLGKLFVPARRLASRPGNQPHLLLRTACPRLGVRLHLCETLLHLLGELLERAVHSLSMLRDTLTLVHTRRLFPQREWRAPLQQGLSREVARKRDILPARRSR